MSTPPEPTPDRPSMPKGYGVQGAARTALVPWSRVGERMGTASNYWIGTTRPDGRPHAMPVWGLWLDGGFYFATDRDSRKVRNLVANPAIVVHLESGDEVVILEGVAEEVAAGPRRAAFDDAYFAKYGVRMAEVPGDVSVWAVQPAVVFAWQERDFLGSATRWTFREER